MRFFYSGGNYNNSGNGLASFNGANSRGNSNTNIGFRAALPRQPDILYLLGMVSVQRL